MSAIETDLDTDLRNVLMYPWLTDLAAALPKAISPARGGRPRDFDGQPYVYLIFAVVATHEGSADRAERALRSHKRLWPFICHLVEERWPDRPELWLDPARPVRRHHWQYIKKLVKSDDPAWNLFNAQFMKAAISAASAAGFCRTDAPGSLSNPHESAVVIADTTVPAAMTRYKAGSTRVDPKTGATKSHRYDPDARPYGVNGRGPFQDEEERPPFRIVYGVPINVLAWHGGTSVRRMRPHERFVFMARSWDVGGGEFATTVDMMKALVEEAPGIRALLTDGVGRGHGIDTIETQTGVIVITPPRAKRSRTKLGRIGQKKDRVPYVKVLQSVEVRSPGLGLVEAEIVTVDGSVHLDIPDMAGGVHRIRLEQGQVRRRQLVDHLGTGRRYTIYVEFLLPAEYGGGTVLVRMTPTEDDRKIGFNLCEYVRVFPPGEPVYERLFRRRAGIETINQMFDRSHLPTWGRARSLGARGQLLDFLVFGLIVNARAFAEYGATPVEMAAG